MDTTVVEAASKDQKTKALLVFTFQEDPIHTALPTIGKEMQWLQEHPALVDFGAKKNETCVLHAPKRTNIERIIAIGLGKRESFKAEHMRHAAATGLRLCRTLKLATCAVALENLSWLGDAPQLCEEVAYGGLLGLYSFDQFKTTMDEPRFDLDALSFLTGTAAGAEVDAAILRGEAAAYGVSKTRDLANGPANSVTPSYLASVAQEMAEKYGFSTISFGRKEIEEMGMGAFASVAVGAEEEPRFVVLEHCPEGAEKQKPLIFVGKGVTFDTGGISLKPSANMHEMKADMAGAGAVLGLFEALGRTQYERRVIGIMPCTENMPDGRATRPGDIVTTMSGKTVEITNTDAEGRMALCDALTWAQKEYDPEAIIDLATLTGACVVALGHEVAAVFSNDEPLRRQICELGETTGDLFWPLPMWDLYFEPMKSDVADMKNAGSRMGGACSAAQFLNQFIEKDTRYAHLDIAGPAHGAKKSALFDSGATGFSVRTLLELVRHGVAPK